MATELHLGFRRRLRGAVLLDELEHEDALLAGIGGGLQNRLEEAVGDERAGVLGGLVGHVGGRCRG